MRALWHRVVLTLVLLAFVLPVPGRVPADNVRASYIAAGLLCSADGDSPSHRDAHCVLCLLPATGFAPDAIECAAPEEKTLVAVRAIIVDLAAVIRAKTHNARAPPSSIV